MSADDYPDYDLSFLDGTTGSDLGALSKGLDSAAADLQKRASDLDGTAEGQTVERVHQDLISIKQALDTAAGRAASAAAAFQDMKNAWDTWKANAPKHAELVAAEKAVADAREALKAADNHHAALFRAALKRAQEALRDLIAKREAADAALSKALDEAKKKLGEGSGWGNRDEQSDKDGETPASAPGSGSPAPKTTTAPGPGSESPAAASTPAPAAAPAPATGAAPAPETAPSSTTNGSGLSPTTAAALGAALAQQQPQQSQAQPQMPMMPQIPMAAQQPNTKPAGQGSPNGDGVIGTDDILRALGPAAAAAALPLGAAGLGAAASFAPVTVAAPATSPSAPWSSTSPAPNLSVAPAVNPVTTGTSIAGLVTDNNVTGRPDNVASRSAFAPNPGATATASHLAGAQVGGGAAAGGTTTGSAGAAGVPGAGMPMMPMMPIAGTGAGAAQNQRDPVSAKLTPEQQELMGLPTIAESVAGGTIAQRGVDDLR